MGHSRLINSALAKNCGHRNHLGPLTPPLPLAHALAASAAASSPPRRSRSAAVSRRSSIQSRRDGSRRTAESAPKRSWICDHPAREIRRSITPDASRWGNFPAGGEQGRLIGITGSPFRDRACRQHREDEGLPDDVAVILTHRSQDMSNSDHRTGRLTRRVSCRARARSSMT